jgi:hypothetical protein
MNLDFFIGDVVSYVTRKAKFEIKNGQKVATGFTVEEGKGKVLAIACDHQARLVVQIKTTDNVFNVDFAAVNPTPEFVEKYKLLIDNIAGFTEEGRRKANEVATEYNGKIDQLTDEVLGKPMELDYAEEETIH